ncbi:MAG TPA: endonuclease/exonuclease/phosphatase family protein [Myxococcota bacterium]|nr:endonuclease/exonuclease/phosphatase family protein [Myxococcota bacterium]
MPSSRRSPHARTEDAIADSLRIVSYNVHCCVGRSGLAEPARIADVLREMRADVACLQEVDSGYVLRQGDQLAALAELTGLRPVSGATLSSDDGEYGNALLSRFPLRRVRSAFYEGAGERRGALSAEIDWEGELLGVTVTHFGLSARDRAAQAQALVKLTGERPDGLDVIAGDFNEWQPFSAALLHLDARLGPGVAPRTFPARCPLLRLDRIWVTPRERVLRSGVLDTPAARRASDHLPVWVDVEPRSGRRPPTQRRHGKAERRRHDRLHAPRDREDPVHLPPEPVRASASLRDPSQFAPGSPQTRAGGARQGRLCGEGSRSS